MPDRRGNGQTVFFKRTILCNINVVKINVVKLWVKNLMLELNMNRLKDIVQ